MKEFWTAFAKAQAEMPVLIKVAANPHHKSRYPDLHEVITKITPVLHKHGLVFSHSVESDDGETVNITLNVIHCESMQVRSMLFKARPEKPTAQSVGSLITYMKRYSLVAFFGLSADEDDDGNKASGFTQTTQKQAKYLGSPPQKQELVKLLNKAGVKDPTEMKAISDAAKGVEMSELESFVKSRLETKE